MKMITLLAIVFAFLLSCNNLVKDVMDKQDDSDNSGVEGKVLRGPTCPVLSDIDPCPDEPFSAIFHVFSNQSEVKIFQSDSLGNFRIGLEPGIYLVCILPGRARASSGRPRARTIGSHICANRARFKGYKSFDDYYDIIGVCIAT